MGGPGAQFITIKCITQTHGCQCTSINSKRLLNTGHLFSIKLKPQGPLVHTGPSIKWASTINGLPIECNSMMARQLPNRVQSTKGDFEGVFWRSWGFDFIRDIEFIVRIRGNAWGCCINLENPQTSSNIQQTHAITGQKLALTEKAGVAETHPTINSNHWVSSCIYEMKPQSPTHVAKVLKNINPTINT